MTKENLQIGKQYINRVYLVVETLLNYEQDKNKRTVFSHTLCDVNEVQKVIYMLVDEFEQNGKVVIEE